MPKTGLVRQKACWTQAVLRACYSLRNYICQSAPFHEACIHLAITRQTLASLSLVSLRRIRLHERLGDPANSTLTCCLQMLPIARLVLLMRLDLLSLVLFTSFGIAQELVPASGGMLTEKQLAARDVDPDGSTFLWLLQDTYAGSTFFEYARFHSSVAGGRSSSYPVASTFSRTRIRLMDE